MTITLRALAESIGLTPQAWEQACLAGSASAVCRYWDGRGPPPAPALCDYRRAFGVHARQAASLAEQERMAWAKRKPPSEIVAAPVYDR